MRRLAGGRPRPALTAHGPRPTTGQLEPKATCPTYGHDSTAHVRIRIPERPSAERAGTRSRSGPTPVPSRPWPTYRVCDHGWLGVARAQAGCRANLLQLSLPSGVLIQIKRASLSPTAQ